MNGIAVPSVLNNATTPAFAYPRSQYDKFSGGGQPFAAVIRGPQPAKPRRPSTPAIDAAQCKQISLQDKPPTAPPPTKPGAHDSFKRQKPLRRCKF